MPKKIAPFQSLRFSNFRLFWLALFVSQLAAQMQIVAVNWHVYDLTKNPISLGFIGLAGFVPIFLFSLIGGVVADKHNRKIIMIISQATLAISSLLLVFASLNNFISPVVIYLVVGISALVSSFDLPARQSSIPLLVPKEFLVNAISTTTLMRQTTLIVGPSIAGFFIEFFGPQSIYIFNVFAFFLSVILLLPLVIPSHVSEKVVSISIRSILEGIRFVKNSPLIYSTMLLDFFATFFASATVLLPIFAQEILHTGPKGLGLLYSAPAVGAVIAGIIVSSMHTIDHQGKVIIGSVIVFGLATIGFGISSSFLLSLFLLSLVGAGDIVSAIIRNTIRQIITPNYLRGRMVSINMIFFVGGPYLGEAEAGLLAAALGTPASVVIGGVGTVLVTILIAVVIPALARYKGHELKL